MIARDAIVQLLADMNRQRVTTKRVPRFVTVILDVVSATLMSLVPFAAVNYWAPHFDSQRSWFFVALVLCALLGAGYLRMRYPTESVLMVTLFLLVILVLEMVLALAVGGPLEL